MFKKYYIEQYKVKMDDSSGQPGQVKEVIEKFYIKFEQGKDCIEVVQTKDYKEATLLGFIAASIMMYKLKRRRFQDKTTRYALVSEQDVKFIEFVTNNR